MSVWDTNPLSKFRDPHQELICHNKWHPGTFGISTPPKIVVGIHFNVKHGTKLPQYFCMLIEPLDHYLEDCSPYNQEAHWNQKAPTHVFSRQQVFSKKPKKVKASTLITNTSRNIFVRDIVTWIIFWNISRAYSFSLMYKTSRVIVQLFFPNLLQYSIFNRQFILFQLL